MWVEGKVERCAECYYILQMTATEEAQEKEPVCGFNRYPIRLIKACLVGPTDKPIIFSINGKTPQPARASSNTLLT